MTHDTPCDDHKEGSVKIDMSIDNYRYIYNMLIILTK